MAMVMRWLDYSCPFALLLFLVVVSAFTSTTASNNDVDGSTGRSYGRVSKTPPVFRLTRDEIDAFFRDGLVTIPNVLTEEELRPLQEAFDRFMYGTIHVPGKDLCDISKPFGTPREEWSIVNAMLPTKYDPSLQNNVYEQITKNIVDQLFPQEIHNMTKDYDQLLNKFPGKSDAVFAWHQDMGYWPGSKALGVNTTATATFSLALDDSTEENGCLRYVVGSGVSKTLRPHVALVGSRDEGHALTIPIGDDEEVRFAPATRGSLTIHDEYVVHGSGGNNSPNMQRKTYVVAYRAGVIVDAERRIGFTHSHNDEVNWDTFHDGESHRIKVAAQEAADASKEEL
jgi:phytanoyl-CoA hydroxylase